MIVYTSNGLSIFESRTDAPATDWTGRAEHIIDEANPTNAELIAKIKAYAPYFDYVLDDDGNLIDVIKTADKPEPDQRPDPIADLQEENKALRAQVAALTQSTQFLEDCIAEMAETVYA